MNHTNKIFSMANSSLNVNNLKILQCSKMEVIWHAFSRSCVSCREVPANPLALMRLNKHSKERHTDLGSRHDYVVQGWHRT